MMHRANASTSALCKFKDEFRLLALPDEIWNQEWKKKHDGNLRVGRNPIPDLPSISALIRDDQIVRATSDRRHNRACFFQKAKIRIDDLEMRAQVGMFLALSVRSMDANRPLAVYQTSEPSEFGVSRPIHRYEFISQ